MSNEYEILVLPGDGVGPEVTAQAVRVLDWFRDRRRLPASLTERGFGFANWQKHGTLMPEETWQRINASDAILFGAAETVDPKLVPAEERRKGGLLRIRKSLDVFANMRPVTMQPALMEGSPYKDRITQGVDLVILRELTAGMYFGTPRGVETLPDGSRRGVNTHSYTEAEIIRIARFAFELARTRRNHVTSVDKSNVMEAGALWRDVVTQLHRAEFSDVRLDHLLADNAFIQLARDPRRFDVVVTDNLFGDLISDAAGAILGSLGMLPSASVSVPGPDGRRKALYEPIHGSAPDIAGQGIANPLGAIISVGMMLRWTFGMAEEASRLDRAVAQALAGGARTRDIAAPGEAVTGTTGMGDAVIAALEAGR